MVYWSRLHRPGNIAEVTLGICYENCQLVINELAVGGNLLIPSDKMTMEVIRGIGNSIYPSILLEVDNLSSNEDGKMLILDLCPVCVQDIHGLHRIVHKFFAKDVSSKAVMFAKAALFWRQKQTVLTLELLRFY